MYTVWVNNTYTRTHSRARTHTHSHTHICTLSFTQARMMHYRCTCLPIMAFTASRVSPYAGKSSRALVKMRVERRTKMDYYLSIFCARRERQMTVLLKLVDFCWKSMPMPLGYPVGFPQRSHSTPSAIERTKELTFNYCVAYMQFRQLMAVSTRIWYCINCARRLLTRQALSSCVDYYCKPTMMGFQCQEIIMIQQPWVKWRQMALTQIKSLGMSHLSSPVRSCHCFSEHTHTAACMDTHSHTFKDAKAHRIHLHSV